MRSYQDLTKANMKDFVELFAKIYEEKVNKKVNKLNKTAVIEVKVKNIVVNSTRNCRYDLEIITKDKKTGDNTTEIMTFDTTFFDYSAKTTCVKGYYALLFRDYNEIYYEFMIGLHPTFAEDALEYLKEEKKNSLDFLKVLYEQHFEKINSDYDTSMDFIKSKQEELHPNVNP